MKKKIASQMFLVLLLLGASASVFCIQSAQASQGLATVYVEPTLSYALSGQFFTVDMMIKDVERLHTWQVNMTFNPNVLQLVDVTEGDFLRSQPEGTWFPSPTVDNISGFVLFNCSTQGQYLGVNGSGWLATIEFHVLDSGLSVLHMVNGTGLWEYRPPPRPSGETVFVLIPHVKEDGYFFTEVAELLYFFYELSVNYTALLANYTALSANYDSLTLEHQSLLTECEDLQREIGDYATLRADFNSLSAAYTSLQSEHTDLQSRFDALSREFAAATNLNYLRVLVTAIFVVTTTTIFVVTILFLLKRKKKQGALKENR